MNRLLTAALVLSTALPLAVPAIAQTAVPANAGDHFRDTSMLKPPAGAKVALIEFEDLECPACAADTGLVHNAVAKYKIPFVRHDYPLTEIHIWSFDAAVYARYIQDKISPALADMYRKDVFAHQVAIDNRDTLTAYTRKWFTAHGKALPFVIDADGTCKAEVKADRALGDRLGVQHTPCIMVVTQNHWTQVVDVSQLNHVIEVAMAEKTPAVAPKRTK